MSVGGSSLLCDASGRQTPSGKVIMAWAIIVRRKCFSDE